MSHLLFPWTRSRSDFGRRAVASTDESWSWEGDAAPNRAADRRGPRRARRERELDRVDGSIRKASRQSSERSNRRRALLDLRDPRSLCGLTRRDCRDTFTTTRDAGRVAGAGRRDADGAPPTNARIIPTYRVRLFSNFPTGTRRLRQFAFAAASPPLRLEHPHPVRARLSHLRLVRREFDRVRGCG